eukprot:TRINITY_DN2253_c0_g1_i2.p1 TRINITY_DN2253_c0_g1~~TRINITY_DN2253_c0_g1_i2.p1  ORF type:complete len:178 (+),score=58.54 TRINITY_DN2253_c0_g1_i2:57-590(+)
MSRFASAVLLLALAAPAWCEDAASLDEKVVKQLEYEVQLEAEAGSKSKIVLALIEMFGLGALGVDRCYMGSYCLGTVKALTGGGFIIWALVDYFNIVINCLTKKDTISSIGYNATFAPNTVDVAFYIVIVIFALKCITGCMRAKASASGREISADDLDTQESMYPEPSQSDYAKLMA